MSEAYQGNVRWVKELRKTETLSEAEPYGVSGSSARAIDDCATDRAERGDQRCPPFLFLEAPARSAKAPYWPG